MDFVSWQNAVDTQLAGHGVPTRCAQLSQSGLLALYNANVSPVVAYQRIAAGQVPHAPAHAVATQKTARMSVDTGALAALSTWMIVIGWLIAGGWALVGVFFLFAVVLGSASNATAGGIVAIGVAPIIAASIMGATAGALFLVIGHLIPVFVGIYENTSRP